GNKNNNNNNNENTTPKANFTNILRPNSKYLQRHFNNTTDKLPSTTASSSTIPRLPPVTRRLSLTIPVMTTTITTNIDDDSIKSSVPSTSMRQIPIQLLQTSTLTSTPTNNTCMPSTILRSSSLSNPFEHKKTDLQNDLLSSPPVFSIYNPQQSSSSSSSGFSILTANTSPIRRAEQQQQQQQNGLLSENNTRSPSAARRVVINLKNNQSVSLDSRLPSAMKPPPSPSSSRITQRNNFFHIPVLHEIQVPARPIPRLSETSSQSLSTSNSNNENYKNEFHLEIPVTITTSNDQENQSEL
ncbi:unnamed protein product, partial [Rotaria magnacalcarata]